MWKSINGIVDAELTSAEPEAALTAINEIGIELWHLRQTGVLSYRFRLRRTDLAKLSGLCQKRGETLQVKKRLGLYWQLAAWKKRPILLLGMTLCLVAVLLIPTRVYFVRVSGNETVPTRRILAAAEESGIHFGAKRKAVRSEKVKNDLLAAVPELEWAGVNTSGCIAVVSVREGSAAEDVEAEGGVRHIAAARDGYLLSGTVVRGTPMFQPGQTVRQGQILISGYTDCGLTIRAERAEGEIFARTNRSFEAHTPAVCVRKSGQGDSHKKYSLLIGKKRINLWKGSGISDTTCGRMYKEYYMTLPGGFVLPVALCVDTYSVANLEQQEISPLDAEKALTQFAEACLQQEMVSGTIQEKQESVGSENGCYVLRGDYDCTEMIGRVSREQIGEIHVKSG